MIWYSTTMPELPEVETIVARLRPLLRHKTIKQIQIFRPKSFHGDPTMVRGRIIADVTRRAKLLRFHLGKGFNLLAHLKMTGQFIYLDDGERVGGGHPSADWTRDLPSSHTRVMFDLDDGTQLFFNDMRVFGWIKVMSDAEVADEYAHLGPDIIDESVTPEYFGNALKQRSIKIKQAIMDNNIVAGVGNIYACDGLNLAKIDPYRPANSLSPKEAQRLLTALKIVISRGIELQGATIDTFSHVDGLAGGYQHEVLVYGREGEACYNCGGLIVKEKIGGRGTYFCRECQR